MAEHIELPEISVKDMQGKNDPQQSSLNLVSDDSDEDCVSDTTRKAGYKQEKGVYYKDINTQIQLEIGDDSTYQDGRNNKDVISDQKKAKIKEQRKSFTISPKLICTVIVLGVFALVFVGLICMNAFVLTNRVSDIQTNSITKQLEVLQQTLRQPSTQGSLNNLPDVNNDNNANHSMQNYVFNVGLKDDKILQDCRGFQFKQSFPDVDYALFGYNILKGYPLTDGHDPGFTYPIFIADYSEGRQTSDCRYHLPFGLSIVPDVSCSVSFSSTVVQNMFQLSKSLKTSASISGGGWGASFSASAGYKQSTNQMSTGEYIFIISEAKCMYYFSKFLVEKPPPFSDSFLIWVYRLNSSDIEKEYFAFFDTYGTHFPTFMNFGSRFTYRYRMSSVKFKSETAKGVNVAIQASYSGLFSAGGGFSMDSSQQQAAEDFSKSVETKVITVGAPPPANGDAMGWASEVKESPVPMDYTLQPIANLFSRNYMEALNVDFSAIAYRLKKFQYTYCNYLKNLDQVYSCASLNPGLMLEKTSTIGNYWRIKRASTKNDCPEICLDEIDCVVVTFCSNCSAGEVYCKMYKSSEQLMIGPEISWGYWGYSLWKSVVFTEKIESILHYYNTTIIGISRASEAVQSKPNLIECMYECAKDAYCVAYTFCSCPDITVHCQLYDTTGITKLRQYNGTNTYFMSNEKRNEITDNLSLDGNILSPQTTTKPAG